MADAEPPLQTVRVFVSPINGLFGAAVVHSFRQAATNEEDAVATGETDGAALVSDSGGERESPASPGGEVTSAATDVIPKARVHYEFMGIVDSGADTADIPANVSVVSPQDEAGYRYALLAADWVIFDITRAEPAAVARASAAHAVLAAAESDERNAPRRFGLVSSFMTWAKTTRSKSPLTVDEFIFRTPHPHFQPHYACERAVTAAAAQSPWLQSFVLSTGVFYGDGEGLFNTLFRQAWRPYTAGVPLFGDGTNTLPTIHVSDCCSLLLSILSAKTAPDACYVGCDQAEEGPTLGKIVEAVASVFCDKGRPANVVKLSSDDAYFFDELSQLDVDTLLADVALESSQFAPCMQFNWVSPKSVIADMDARKQEYIAARGLEPICVAVVGPPSTGKSTLSREIATRFGLMHVNAQSAIAYTRAKLEENVVLAETRVKELASHSDDTENGDKVSAANKDITAAKAQLEEFNNVGRFDSERIAQCFRTMLDEAHVCHYQGYVLDGFPKNVKQMESLFGTNEKMDNPPAPPKAPDFLFVTKADESFVKSRLLQLPEKEVAASAHNLTDTLSRRWQEFANPEVDKKSKNTSPAEGGFDPASLFIEPYANPRVVRHLDLQELLAGTADAADHPSPEEVVEREAHTILAVVLEHIGYPKYTVEGQLLTNLVPLHHSSRKDGDSDGTLGDVLKKVRMSIREKHRHHNHKRHRHARLHYRHQVKNRVAHAPKLMHQWPHFMVPLIFGGSKSATVDPRPEDAITSIRDEPAVPDDANLEGTVDDRLWASACELEDATAGAQTYLKTRVLPSLAKVLLDVLESKPADPIEYVSQQLFKQAEHMRKSADIENSTPPDVDVALLPSVQEVPLATDPTTDGAIPVDVGAEPATSEQSVDDNV